MPSSVAAILRRPASFAGLAAAAYLLLLVPLWLHGGLDPSVFIVAGDRYVDSAHLVSPITVRPHSDGYDGQFYFRLALAPFDTRNPAFGITLDTPPYRMQRILYPLLAWLVSFGQPALAPAALLLVNVAALAGIAAFAVRITRRLGLGWATPLAIVLWPGVIVSIAHDTTELTSACLLLAALDAYLADRLGRFAALGMLAALAREVGVLFLAGILCYEIVVAARAANPAAAVRNFRIQACIFPVLGFLAWQREVAALWGHTARETEAGHNLTWPFVGVAQRLFRAVGGADHYFHKPAMNLAMHAFIAVSIVLLLWFCAAVALRLPRLLRGPAAPLAAAWLPIAGLMTLLSAQGPWIDPIGYFRAFTECAVLGGLLLGLAPAPAWWWTRLMLAAELLCAAAAWGLCAVSLA